MIGRLSAAAHQRRPAWRAAEFLSCLFVFASATTGSGLIVHGAAAQPADKYRLSAGWTGEATFDRRKKLRWCNVRKFVPSGTSISVSVFSDVRVLFSAFRSDWRLKDTRTANAEFLIDSYLVPGRLQASDQEFLVLIPTDPALALREFAEGLNIVVRTSGREARADLTGSRVARDFLLRCARQYSSLAYERITRPLDASNLAAPTPPERQAEPERSKSGSASGFFVTSEGLLLTNAHVISGCHAVTATDENRRKYPARVIARDERNDLALLSTNRKSEQIARFRPAVRQGESVFAFGFPLAGVLATSGNFTVGHVTAVAGLRDDTRMLQISAPIQPGNSGGPLFDDKGNVVGVVVAKFDAIAAAKITHDVAQNINFAVKADIAQIFVASHDAKVRLEASSLTLPADKVAEVARGISAFIECNR